MNYVFICLAIIPALSALILPWLMVREGYRELVMVYCFITTILSLSLVAGVIGHSDDFALATLWAGLATYSALMAASSFLPLWLTRQRKS